MGYWNDFTPVLDYTGTDAYADSVQRYVECGLIAAPSELYYPIRLKPRGENTLSSLRRNGVNHIELRMIDLNPLRNESVDLHDVIFAQLLTVWDAAKPTPALSADRQILCVANFKSVALIFDGTLTDCFADRQTGQTDSERILLLVIDRGKRLAGQSAQEA